MRISPPNSKPLVVERVVRRVPLARGASVLVLEESQVYLRRCAPHLVSARKAPVAVVLELHGGTRRCYDAAFQEVPYERLAEAFPELRTWATARGGQDDAWGGERDPTGG